MVYFVAKVVPFVAKGGPVLMAKGGILLVAEIGILYLTIYKNHYVYHIVQVDTQYKSQKQMIRKKQFR